MTEDMVSRRRTIEALRSGVPNRDAVSELGSSQTEIETRFDSLLSAVEGGGGNSGLLIGGGFGTGKSHLLEYLHHLALDRGFVTSKVVISKETPLHDPVKVFRTAIATASVPGRRGSAIGDVARDLDFGSDQFRDLSLWVESNEAALNERFGATLYLYKDLRGSDEEFAESIVRFWSGDPIAVGVIKRRLREAGESASYPLSRVTVRELALQRFRFASRLMRAAGHNGWILLLDEVELIGRYSLLQRGKSYAEIARWVSGFEEDPIPGLGAVLAVSDDLQSVVIDEKNDHETVPARLRARGDELLATRAKQGIATITRGTIHLERPDRTVLDETYAKLRRLHSEAYGWEAPELEVELGSLMRTMRQYVRSWINEWDLRRLTPSYRPAMEVGELRPDYSEDSDLEVAPEEESEAERE